MHIDLTKIYLSLLRKKYRLLSTNKIHGKPCMISPVLSIGNGTIEISNSSTLGYYPSPLIFSTYIHIEARNPFAAINIGDRSYINNGCVIIAENTQIDIGSDCLIGTNVYFFDSDFHDLNPERRSTGTPTRKPISIDNNVFIGSNVIILKGVHIGENTVISAGSVVTKSFGDNVIIGGNPAKILRSL